MWFVLIVLFHTKINDLRILSRTKIVLRIRRRCIYHYSYFEKKSWKVRMEIIITFVVSWKYFSSIVSLDMSLIINNRFKDEIRYLHNLISLNSRTSSNSYYLTFFLFQKSYFIKWLSSILLNILIFSARSAIT